MPFKTALEAAIAHLVSKGRIKGSSDVAKDLGLKSRGTVSNYATGKTKLSNGFQTNFENKYGVKLAEFEHLVDEGVKNEVDLVITKGNSIAVAETKNPGQNDQDLRELIASQKKYIALLEKQTQMEDFFKEKIDRLVVRLDALRQDQLNAGAIAQAYREYLIAAIGKTQGMDVDGKDIHEQIRRRAYEILLNFEESGIEIQKVNA